MASSEMYAVSRLPWETTTWTRVVAQVADHRDEDISKECTCHNEKYSTDVYVTEITSPIDWAW